MRRRQQGLHTVEFAVAGLLFLVLLFGVLEFGRALFVWNSLTEATRRGARVAASCPEGSATAIENAVRFLPELRDNGTVSTEYIRDGRGHVLYVRVALTGYQHHLLLPLFDQWLPAPDFATTLPREGLGVGASIACE